MRIANKKAKLSADDDPQRRKVLIWLPPSPPPEMNDPRRSERLKTDAVQTTTPVPHIPENSGSRWGVCELKRLKVKFEPDEHKECLDVLSLNPDWTEPHRQRIIFFIDKKVSNVLL